MSPIACLLLGLLVAQPAPTMPVAPPHMMPGNPAPVIPDTVLVELTWPGGERAALVAVHPDSVILGDPVFIEWSAAVPDSLVLPPWLEPAPDLADAGTGGSVLPVRVYRLAPFRLQVEETVSAVITVTGRNADAGTIAPIRLPRLPGWAWRTALILLAVLLAVAWLGRRLWLRRRGPFIWGRDREPAGAAWPRAARDLADLLDDLQGSGRERAFLDGLRRVARTYVSERFLVHGREMTGPEIEATCVELGHERPLVRRFGRLLESLDRHRYDPAPVSEAWCREQAVELLAAMDAVRMAPPPADEEAAAGAWSRLQRDLAPTESGA